MIPPSHTWAGDGGESPATPLGLKPQTQTLILTSPLQHQQPLQKSAVCCYTLCGSQGAGCLSLPAGLPSFLALGPARGRGRVGRGKGGWLAIKAMGWLPQGCAIGDTVASAKSSVGGGHSCVPVSSWATIHLTFLILSAVPWL